MEEIAEAVTRGRARLMSDFPLLHYAVTSWMVHARRSETSKHSRGDVLNHFSWPSEHLVQLWVQVYRIIAGYSDDCPPEGTSMLHVISRYQLMEPLWTVLQKADQVGTDINAKDENGLSPLSYAAGEGHEAIVQLLLKKGADVNSADRFGQTPLSRAAREGHEAIVRLLLEKGPDIHSADRFGRTPLSGGAENGHEAIVRLLLENGADVDSADEDGRTPLLWAAENGYEAILRLMLKGKNKAPTSKSRRTSHYTTRHRGGKGQTLHQGKHRQSNR